MRVQSVVKNNYSNGVVQSPKKNPAFEANVYAVFEKSCHEGRLCDSALEIISSKFMKEAIEKGKVLMDNIAVGMATYGKDGKAEFILLDKTTKLFEEIIKKPLRNEEDTVRLLEKVKNDPATEKLKLAVTEDEFCPGAALRKFITAQNN